MKPRPIFNSKLFRYLSDDFDAICIGRFILFRDSDPSPRLVRHEMIHQQQMDHYTVPGFYILYLWYWLKGLVIHRTFHLAYRENPLEVEAYEREKS